MASRDDTVLSQALLLNRSSPVLSQACNIALKFLLNFFCVFKLHKWCYCNMLLLSYAGITW